MPDVSAVTLRRDIVELAEAGAVKRTHGGAVLPDADMLRARTPDLKIVDVAESSAALERADAFILPPVTGRGANALRRQIQLSSRPFLAESAPQAGGIYFGPDNSAAGTELGARAAQDIAPDATVLMICQPELSNTAARAAGFEAGVLATNPDVTILRVNGGGNYRTARRVALDAFRSDPAISVVFGVNDHSTIGGLDAADTAERNVRAYGMGGESHDFLSRLTQDDSLIAVAALFPEIAGDLGIDLIAGAFCGRALPKAAITPHAIVDRDTLWSLFAPDGETIRLRDGAAETLGLDPVTPEPRTQTKGRIVSFMPHYPAHDWYREMIAAMQARAAGYGIDLAISRPATEISAEISRLRTEIAVDAASRVKPGQTIILGQGEATEAVALELHRRARSDISGLAGVTIITNSFDILQTFSDPHPFKVILTSGEFQRADNCLVGPSLGAVFDRLRADVAFITGSGLSADFGLSTEDERLALASSRFMHAARRTIALVDHTALGADATHLIGRADMLTEIITDDGALPAERQRLRAVGVDVHIAGEANEDAPQNTGAPPMRRPVR